MRNAKGFTLIELSIVLVIIGLIVGGILVGRDMVRAAELRSVVTDVERFRTAVNTFRTKYNCIPGDCLNSTDFFGNDSSCPHGDGTGTCNGNGDGNIDWPRESLRAWQHMQLAGVIGGNFKGSDVNDYGLIGVNSPVSKISDVGYSIGYLNHAGIPPAGGYDLVDSPPYNRIVVGGGMHVAFGNPPNAAFMTPYEAKLLDQKIDDGRSSQGMMTVIPSGNSAQQVYVGPCAIVGAGVSAADPNAFYFMGEVGKTCPAVFKLQ